MPQEGQHRKGNDESSREASKVAKEPMAPKSEETKAVEKGKNAGNPMGERAKAHGHEEHEGEKNPNLP